MVMTRKKKDNRAVILPINVKLVAEDGRIDVISKEKMRKREPKTVSRLYILRGQQ